MQLSGMHTPFCSTTRAGLGTQTRNEAVSPVVGASRTRRLACEACAASVRQKGANAVVEKRCGDRAIATLHTSHTMGRLNAVQRCRWHSQLRLAEPPPRRSAPTVAPTKHTERVHERR